MNAVGGGPPKSTALCAREGNIVAQKVQVVLVDDLDGGEASETVTFGLEGISYEIDLSESNAAALRADIAPWIAAGRRVSGRKSSSRARSSSDAAKVREWARANGYDVPNRGRVSASIREAYVAAH